MLMGIPDASQDKKDPTIPSTSGTVIPPFKLVRKVMMGTDVPENHVIANLEACQV